MSGPTRKSGWLITVVLVASAVGTPAPADNNSSAPVQGWTRLDTVPYTLNNKQDAIAFADAQTGWYGNGTGKVYGTTDGGKTWRNIWSRPGTYVRSLEFADDRTGFLGNIGPDYYPAVKDINPLYVTHDGGAHWTPVTSVSGSRIKGVCAIDVLKIGGKVVAIRAGGRVGGPAGMMESFDEGKTWRARDMREFTGMILDIHFVDENVGFISGATGEDESRSNARILKTTDGGKTWRVVFATDTPNDINWKISFPSADVGYASIISYQAPDGEARGYVVKTDDGGEHWRKLKVTDDKDWIPYGINFMNTSRGWIGGSTGGYETTDGGQSWHAVMMGKSTNKIRVEPRSDGGTSVFAIGLDVYQLVIPKN